MTKWEPKTEAEHRRARDFWKHPAVRAAIAAADERAAEIQARRARGEAVPGRSIDEVLKELTSRKPGGTSEKGGGER